MLKKIVSTYNSMIEYRNRHYEIHTSVQDEFIISSIYSLLIPDSYDIPGIDDRIIFKFLLLFC